MKRFLILICIMFGLINSAHSNYSKLAYDFEFNGIEGDIIKLSKFKDKVIVVVNVASRCGYTNQYEDLQIIWDKYQKKNLIVIGVHTNNFKQKTGSNSQIKSFCETNFGVNFPMSEKVNVIGKNSHPFYKWAKKNHGLGAIPKWNFHKIIIGKNGKIVDTFASFTKPTSDKFIKLIEKEIKN